MKTVTFRHYISHEVDSICQTDKNCKIVGLCTDKQGHHVIDFDKLKDTYYNKVTQKPASVDAVCVGNLQKYFCFVELKGWRNYVLHLKKQKKEILKKQQKNIIYPESSKIAKGFVVN